MEHLSLHIKYLLLRHDCVILPGFGAFINARKPARYDASEGKWYPMTREVRFNQAVNQDDGLLANSYSRKYSLPFNEARTILTSDIKELRSVLEEEGEVTIGALGSILLGEENTLHFSPANSAEQVSAKLGFIPVTDKIVNISKNDSEITSESNKNLDFNKNYYIPINKFAAKFAASFILVLIAAVSMILPTSERKGEDKASVIPIETIMESASHKNEDQKPDQDIQEVSLATANVADTNENPNDENIIESKSRFYLIVGTFKTEKEADMYISHNDDCDYELISVPSSTLCRVAAKTSNDKSELIKELNSSKFKSRYNGGWIWENKN